MNRFRVVVGVAIMAMGFAIFYTSHTAWGLRGLLYEFLGGAMIYIGLGKENS